MIMKKLIPFFLLMFAATSFTFAQSVIFSDNFDSYTVGSHLAESNPAWTTWSNTPGSAQDGVISDEHYTSPSNSLYISGDNDQIYPFNNITSGRYRVTFNMFVPEGGAAYCNVMHHWQDTAFSNLWAFACYFYPDGTGVLKVGGDTVHFSYPFNAWFPVVLDMDLDYDHEQQQPSMAHMAVNYSHVHTWPFNYGENAPYDIDDQYWNQGHNYLDAIDFYSSFTDYTNTSNIIACSFYVDDFVVSDYTGVSVNEYNPIEVSLYPNPATNHVQISADQIQRVEIYNMLGQRVFDQKFEDDHVIVPTDGMRAGTYAVTVTTRDARTTQKLIIR